MKKLIVKKLSFKKEDITDLSQEEQGHVVGGNFAPTLYDPAHGAYCTNTCNQFTILADNCTSGCTGPCNSNAATGCEDGNTINDCLGTAINLCFTNGNCTYTECTRGCPVTAYTDATCGCTH
jgi:natural product precursor